VSSNEKQEEDKGGKRGLKRDQAILQAIMLRDDLRTIDWELENMLKRVNMMLDNKTAEYNSMRIRRIRDKLEFLNEQLDTIRQDVVNMSEDLREMLEGDLCG